MMAIRKEKASPEAVVILFDKTGFLLEESVTRMGD
jgi:hypothetical protein